MSTLSSEFWNFDEILSCEPLEAIMDAYTHVHLISTLHVTPLSFWAFDPVIYLMLVLLPRVYKFYCLHCMFEADEGSDLAVMDEG